MGQVLVVTSGKGGVGKTTSTAALGAALARGGQKVVVIDFEHELLLSLNRPSYRYVKKRLIVWAAVFHE